jgi:hypothetical protein
MRAAAMFGGDDDDMQEGLEQGTRVRVKSAVTVYHAPKLGDLNLEGKEGTVQDARAGPPHTPRTLSTARSSEGGVAHTLLPSGAVERRELLPRALGLAPARVGKCRGRPAEPCSPSSPKGAARSLRTARTLAAQHRAALARHPARDRRARACARR